MNSLKHNFFF